MGLISSVQTLLHYSSLHQVCSYSHPGFQEFPPLHTVRNIHQRAELSLPHSRKLLTAAPNRASVPRSLQGMEGSLPSFHPALSLHSFFLFLPLPAWFFARKSKSKPAHPPGQDGQERDRAGNRGHSTSDALLHLPKTS